MKKKILGFFREFHDQCRFAKNLNATFLVLIPKKQIVEDFKDLIIKANKPCGRII